MRETIDSCSDQQIIQLIISLKEDDGNLAVQCIYRVYGKSIKWSVRQKIGPTKEELIEDILTDTILAFFNAIRQRRFELKDENSVKAYLNKTAINLLNQEFRAWYKGQIKKAIAFDEVDKYVLNLLNGAERKAFSERLAADANLQEEVALKRQMVYRKINIEALPENLPEEAKKEMGMVEEMKALITQLTPFQQNLMSAHYYQGISLATFAENNSMTPESVRQQHHRCLKKLRQLYQQKTQ